MGLGFPYEGPAPLEAIANGCFFINPKVSKSHAQIVSYMYIIHVSCLLFP